MNKNTSKEVGAKELDSWTEILIFGPLGNFIFNFISKTNINPILITILSLLLGLTSSALILIDKYFISAIFYLFAVVLDNIDGKLARCKGKETTFRKVLDQLVDQTIFCSIIISLGIKFPYYLIYFTILLSLLFIFEISFALRMIVRLEENMVSKTMKKTLKQYESSLKNKGRVIEKLVQIHNFLLSFTSKFGIWPYPKLADIHFLLFLFIFLKQKILILLFIFLTMIPDISISVFLTLILAKKKSKGELNKSQ